MLFRSRRDLDRLPATLCQLESHRCRLNPQPKVQTSGCVISIAGLVPAAGPSYNVTKYGIVAISEGLRATLAQRKIGVSVLCPGFIRTQFANSRRNIPNRLVGAVEGPPTEGPGADLRNAFNERISNGIDPTYVGELVREGIENDWPYIFTDTEFEPLIDARFASIKQGFDRIRGRQPQH